MKTPKELGITKRQMRNIAKLTVWARDNDGKVNFDIGTFCKVKGKDGIWDGFNSMAVNVFKLADQENVCGTCACFAGYGPVAGIRVYKDESWFRYIERCFTNCEWDEDDVVFDLLFAAEHSNSLKAAYLRACYFLEYGLPPISESCLINWEVDKDFTPKWKEIEEIANWKA